MRLFAAFLLIAMTLSGCLASDPANGGPDAAGDADKFTAAAAGLPDFSTMYDVGADTDWWEEFVGRGKRDAYTPDTPVTYSAVSREDIKDRLEALPLDSVTVEMYDAGAFGQTAPGGARQAAAVIGTKAGSLYPDQRIGLIAHYDTQAGTIEGAYDNGGGTAAVISICEILSQMNLTRTLDCILFDAEEVGAVASGQYVSAHADLTYDLVMGFDMIGLNCPGYEWKMYQWVGANHADWLWPFVRDVTHNVTALSEDCAEVFDFNDRNSDESRFASAGYPTVRFAGGRTASGYDQYHKPDDTPEHVYELAGGRANWELGYARTVESAATLAVMFDAFSIDEMQERAMRT